MKNINTLVFYKKTELINLILLAMCVFLIVFYIVQINLLVSREYRVEILNNKLAKLLDQQNNLQADKFISDGMPQVAQFAQKSGMIEANNAVYVFEESSFAQR